MSHNISDRNSALLYLGIGVSFCIVPYGLWIRSRVLVSLISIPLILMLGAVSFMLLFAPFAWGDSNIKTVYLLQLSSLFLAALQIGGLIDVFSARTSMKRNRNADEP
jgi:NADH:ubiquinone oxidoreductase subunit K